MKEGKDLHVVSDLYPTKSFNVEGGAGSYRLLENMEQAPRRAAARVASSLNGPGQFGRWDSEIGAWATLNFRAFFPEAITAASKIAKPDKSSVNHLFHIYRGYNLEIALRITHISQPWRRLRRK